MNEDLEIEEIQVETVSEFQQILSYSERKCIEYLGSVYYAITSEGDMN